jgi:hypothetical protein
MKTRLIQSNVAATLQAPSTYCDQFEDGAGSTSNAVPPADDPTTGHTWVSNFMRVDPVNPDVLGADGTFANTLRGLIASLVGSRYPAPGLLNGLLIDNVGVTANFGAATNRPATIGIPAGGTGADAHPAFAHWCNPGHTNYQGAWQSILRLLHRTHGDVANAISMPQTFGKLWGNNGGSNLSLGVYNKRELDGRFVEFMFHIGSATANSNTIALMRESLRLAAASKSKLIGGALYPNNSTSTQIAQWLSGGDGPESTLADAGGLGNWHRLLSITESMGMLDNFYVLTARTSPGGALMYHPTFGPV